MEFMNRFKVTSQLKKTIEKAWWQSAGPPWEIRTASVHLDIDSRVSETVPQQCGAFFQRIFPSVGVLTVILSQTMLTKMALGFSDFPLICHPSIGNLHCSLLSFNLKTKLYYFKVNISPHETYTGKKKKRLIFPKSFFFPHVIIHFKATMMKSLRNQSTLK